jgi:ABC-type phosphate/phosphonate transport system substrate-binding protein
MSEKARIAGLPMYDTAALRPATDAFWAALRDALIARGIVDAPEGLSHGLEPEALWTHPDLLLAQACGLPLVTLLDRRVRYVATPVYAVRGCEGGAYRSWLVVRADDPATALADLRGSIAAVNARHSQSGANALLALTAAVAGGRPFFADILLTGAHAASLEAVRDGRAACAAIDCVTWHHLGPRAQAGLRILGATPAAPALPYITARHTDDATVSQLQGALGEAIEKAKASCRTLCLAGIVTDAAAYARIRAMLEHGLRHGCARLATAMRDQA